MSYTRKEKEPQTTKIAALFLCSHALRNSPHSALFQSPSDSKTDSKTGRQPWISVDGGGNSIGLWSGWKTSVDFERRGVPKGGLEPPCPFEHNALNVACLPVSPLRRR